MRIITLLLLTMAGAGQTWAEANPDLGHIVYTQGTNDGGVLAFFSAADYSTQIEIDGTMHMSRALYSSDLNNNTVYIKAVPDGIHTCIGVTFSAEQSTSSGAAEAPRRHALDVGIDVEVTAVSGHPGLYQFTMPDNGYNVTITAQFADKPTNTNPISYLGENGATVSKAAGTVYILDGTESFLGIENSTDPVWYVSTDLAYISGLSLKGDVNLLLADGTVMSVTPSDGSAISAETGINLDIYGQSAGNQAGKLIATGTGAGYGIHVGTLTIHGGIIEASSYNGTVETATGQRFVVYDSSTGDAKAIISGTVDSQVINGQTLRPLDGNYVSVNSVDFTFSGSTSVTNPFTITTGEGENETTTHYYIYKKDDPMTLNYTGNDFVQVTGQPVGYAAVEGQPMQRSFTMPATDVVLTATSVTGLTATSATYDGTALTPEIKQGDDVFDAANYAIAYQLGDDAVTEAKNVNTYTCTLTGLGQYFGTTTVSFTIVKADYDVTDITKYVPQYKPGNYTFALPALPDGAAYSFTKTDEGGIIASHAYDAEHNTLTVATNSGTTSGTAATIAVAATGATNYNDYNFTLNVVVSEYTTTYAWPEQTSIWLDADNELIWSADGVTLNTSLLTVKKNDATVTNYMAKVGETVLTAGENLLTLAPGAYRIAITGDDGKLDDWVDFKVIKLIENDQDFSVTFNDFTIPVRTESGYEAGLVAIAGELAYGEYTKSITRSEVVAGDPIVDGNLKVWFDYKDRFSGVPSFSRWIQLDHIYNYKEQYRREFTRFGEIVSVGNYHTVYMPNGTNFNVLYDAFGEPVPADDKGGKIYYMSGFHPNLHTEKTEREVEGKTVTEWVLYDGDTKVEDGYYFRDKNDIYYGDGVNKFKNVSSGDSDELLTLYPIYFFEQDAIALDKEGRWRDGNGIVQRITGYEAFGWNSTKGCAIVGGDYIYIGQLIYLGYAYPGVKPTIDGSIIRIGDEYYDVGEGSPIAYLPNDMIGQFNPPLTLNKWSSAYAKYRVDDYTYQVASRDFIIYPNNSLITVTNNKGTYHVGEKIDIDFTVKSLRDGGLYVFLNGDLYHHFENVGSDELINSVTLSLNDLGAGEYIVTAISDEDYYVTGFETSFTLTVVRNDSEVTLTGKQNTAGEAFETDAEIEYDPENPIVINAVNDKEVSNTYWKWQISNTSTAGVVELGETVNNSVDDAVNSEDINLYTIGLGTVTLKAGFSGNDKYNPATGSITFTVVPKSVANPIIELVDQSTIYYDGTAKEPAVKVYYAEGKEIPADQYDVTYDNNTNVSSTNSKAKIIVKSVDGANYNIDAVKEFVIQETAVTITELPIASTISDGRTLAASTLTGGKAKAGELDVDGIFSWKDKTIAPTLTNSDVTEYDVTFTPNNTNFKTAECQVKLTVMPRAMLFAANSTNLWATFCGKNEYEVPEGCTAYTISSISGSTVTISEVTAEEANAPAIIPAYTPMLIQRDANVTAPVTAAFSAIVTAPTSGYDDQTGLVSTTGSDFTFYGNCSNTAVSPDDFKGHYNEGQTYLLYDGKFILADENGGLGAHKCLLVLNGTNNAPVLSIGETTNLVSIDNGQLTIDNDVWYTLDGRKLQGKPTKKGLYIHNGRKVVIK